ncbi:MAG: PD40 domain-containing protein [Kiritimatiellae bacterium]|nr:PD40 domain-containing protein [Kiritimatiellia bacterium]
MSSFLRMIVPLPACRVFRAPLCIAAWVTLCLLNPGAAQELPEGTPELQLIHRGGLYPKWSHARNLIVFNALRAGNAFTDRIPGTYEIFTMKPDGSDVRWLTEHAPAGLAGFHKGQPCWHPGGDYIVFTAQNEYTKPSKRNMDSFPGIGHNHDVWIMSSDGRRYWRITRNPGNGGVIRPSFSHDGKRLYWNEEYSMEARPGVGSEWSKEKNPKGEEWGLWRIKLADLAFGPDGPRVFNPRTVHINEIHPGLRLIEGSGFTPDDQHLIWEAANIHETGGKMWWGDIYVSDLKGGDPVRLTRSAPLRQGNENMEYSPDGRHIAWSHHDDPEPGKEVEIWLMQSDGRAARQLTYFNKPGHPHRQMYQSRGHTTACGELDWGPGGDAIVFSVSNGARLQWPFMAFNIYRLNLKAARN